MAVLGLALTILIALLTWFFIQRVIINPLHNIMLGTRDVATGHMTQKVKVSGAKEIEELEDAFNQMVEQFQSFTGKLIGRPAVIKKVNQLKLNLVRLQSRSKAVKL